MTDETKKLFDAPYKVYETRNGYNVICTNQVLSQLCWTTDKKDANRIAHLPELYEELKSSCYDFCWSCLATLGIDPPTADELVENLCPRKPNCCGYNNRWKLLRKVRDGGDAKESEADHA